MSESKPTFYDDHYWAEGEGQLLWNMRKMLAFIMKISGPDTPAPFLTAMHKGDSDDTWVGWYASWNENADTSLYIEYEGTAFCVYVMDFDKTKPLGKSTNMRFWYNFGDDTSEDSNEWSDLNKAVLDAKEWLRENHEALLARSGDTLDQEFNIH